MLPLTLTDDSRERLGLIIAIYRELHAYFGAGAADRWPAAPNQGLVFAGEPPLALMMRDGKNGMFYTITHLRALGQGY